MKFRVLAASAIAGCLVPTAFAQLSAIHTAPTTKAQPHKEVAVAPTQRPSHIPLVGGSDSCATPDAISGQGSFPFNNSAATTGAEGQANASCLFFGTMGISNDVWFDWTADATGTATFQLCGGTSMDSKVAVYSGAGCPGGAPLACNDDSCGLESSVTFAASAGSHYTLQLGNFPGASASSGTFSLSIAGAATNDDCSNAVVLSGPGPYPFNNSAASTGSQGQAESVCNFFGTTGISNDVWFTWTATGTGSATVALCGGSSMDSKVAVYAGAGCPSSSALACNDDSCGLQSQVTFAATTGSTYTIQLGNFPGAAGSTGTFTINIAQPLGPCTNHDDGTSDNAIGLTNGGAVMWLQRFGALSQNTTITQISTAWGSPLNPPTGNPTNGTACNVAIYNDPNNDGNPTDGVLMQLVPGTIAGSGTDAFQTFNLSPAVTINGYVWVGAELSHPAGQFPAPLDQSSNPPAAGQAWIVGDTSGTLNFNNLGANNVAPLDIASAGFPGQWLLRVTCAEGSPATDFCRPHNNGGCPCSNPGDAGHGCAGSSNPLGAILSTTGTASLSADTVAMTSANERPNSLTVFLQGTTQQTGTTFGMGVLCTAGLTLRLFTVNSDGTGTAVTPASPSFHVQSASLGDTITAGSSRFYQAFYRDPVVVNGCPATSTFNVSQGQAIVWN
jgi:hypothetical protein